VYVGVLAMVHKKSVKYGWATIVLYGRVGHTKLGLGEVFLHVMDIH